MSRREVPQEREEISPEEGRFLVNLSREAISRYLSKNVVMQPPPETPRNLLKRRGVFVTLRSHPSEELRGCIGFPEPSEKLVKATITAAIESATGDPRFHPVTIEELNKEIVLEVSILTAPEEIKAAPKKLADHVSIGEDGLIVEKGPQRGLLLPQVATEWGWDREEFLTNCCLKAGLPPDEWLLDGTKVYKFQAVAFKERAPKGLVERAL